MENAIHSIQRLTGIKANVLEEIIESTPTLKKAIISNKNFPESLQELFENSKLDKFQFGLLFANHSENFANIKKLNEFASIISTKFPLPYSTCIVEAIKYHNLPRSISPAEMLTEFMNIFFKLDISAFELSQIIEKYPSLISTPTTAIESNISLLSQTYKVPKQELHDIIMMQPKILLCSDLKTRMISAKTLFGFTPQETAAFLKNYYSLLFVPKKQITDTIAYLAHEFYFSDTELVSLLRYYPELCMQSKTRMRELVKTLMKCIGLSTTEIKSIIKAFPRVLSLSSKTVQDKYNELYNSELFVKLDIKKLISLRPEILATQTKAISSNILDVCRVFDLQTKKQTAGFIRNCLKFIAGGDIKSKLTFLDSQGITLGIISNIPTLLDSNQNLLAIKFNTLEPFGLSYYLDTTSNIDTLELISRIKFLSLSGHDISHIELSHLEFSKIYNLNTETLMQEYHVSKPEYKNLINIDFNTNSIKSHFARMLKSNYISDIKIVSNSINKATAFTKKNETIANILETLGLECYDARHISNQLPEFINPESIVGTIEILTKSGITREQIIRIIEKYPTTLTTPLSALEKQITKHKSFIDENKYCLANKI